jgi:hypothetical protein
MLRKSGSRITETPSTCPTTCWRARQAGRAIWFIWFVLFVWLIWFIWLVSFNQTNRIDQTDQMNLEAEDIEDANAHEDAVVGKGSEGVPFHKRQKSCNDNPGDDERDKHPDSQRQIVVLLEDVP